jgi:hypothetical protein
MVVCLVCASPHQRPRERNTTGYASRREVGIGPEILGDIETGRDAFRRNHSGAR